MGILVAFFAAYVWYYNPSTLHYIKQIEYGKFIHAAREDWFECQTLTNSRVAVS